MPAAASRETRRLGEVGRETRVAFVICLDAINFGSGWWATIRKRPALSGYSTVEAGVLDRFRVKGSWPATELVELTAAEIAALLWSRGRERRYKAFPRPRSRNTAY